MNSGNEELVEGKMTKKILTIKKSTQLLHAYKTMRKFRIRHLVVINEKEDIVGVLSDRDVQRGIEVSFENQNNHDVVVEKIPKELLVGDFMSTQVQSVDVQSHVEEVAQTMLKNKISSVLITDKDEVVGLMTTDDLLKLLIDLLSNNPKFRVLDLAQVFDFYSHDLYTTELL